MKRRVLALVMAVLVVGLVHLPASALVNGGFETGTFFGWEVLVGGGNTDVVESYLDDTYTYTPKERIYFALLESCSLRHTAIRQDIHLNAGDVLSGWAVFNNGGCSNITAWAKIVDGGNSVKFDILPGSDWAQWTLTAPIDGDYTLKLVLAKGEYSASSGYLLCDGNPSCPPVPEPASMLLLGTGLLGLVGLRRKGKK